MTTLRAALKAKLEADTTLMATATGGVHSQTEISPSGTPSAYDDRGDLKPSIVLRLSTNAPFGPFDVGERSFFNLYFYDRPQDAYDNIDTMRIRVKDILHTTEGDPKQVTIDPGWLYSIHHADDFGDSWDDTLDCPMSYSRFYAVLLRS